MENTNTQTSPGAMIIASLTVAAILSVVHGSVVMKLWEWYVADPFGVRELGLPLAIGIGSMVSYLTYHIDVSSVGQSNKSAGERLVYAVVARLFAASYVLAVGLLLTRWIS